MDGTLPLFFWAIGMNYFMKSPRAGRSATEKLMKQFNIKNPSRCLCGLTHKPRMRLTVKMFLTTLREPLWKQWLPPKIILNPFIPIHLMKSLSSGFGARIARNTQLCYNRSQAMSHNRPGVVPILSKNFSTSAEHGSIYAKWNLWRHGEGY